MDITYIEYLFKYPFQHLFDIIIDCSGNITIFLDITGFLERLRLPSPSFLLFALAIDNDSF